MDRQEFEENRWTFTHVVRFTLLMNKVRLFDHILDLSYVYIITLYLELNLYFIEVHRTGKFPSGRITGQDWLKPDTGRTGHYQQIKSDEGLFSELGNKNYEKRRVGRQFVPSDNSSQVTIRPKFQKATICHKRLFVPFWKGDNSSHLWKATIRPKLFNWSANYQPFEFEMKEIIKPTTIKFEIHCPNL